MYKKRKGKMMSEKYYCPKCDRDGVDSEIQTKSEEVINVRGVPIKLKNVKVRVCLKCKNEIYDYKIDTPMLVKAYEKYEEKTGKPILEELLKKTTERARGTGHNDPANTDYYIREAIKRLNKKRGKKQ